MNEIFSVKSSECMYEGNIFAVRQDEVVMPGGNIAKRDVVEHFGAVAILAESEGKIALIKQYRHPIGQIMYEIPAGLLDGSDDETPLTAAKRELLEEIGFEAKVWKHLIDIASTPGMTDEVVRVFYATGLIPSKRPEASDEETTIELSWVELDKAVQMVLNGEIYNSTAISSILTRNAISNIDDLKSPEIPFKLRPTKLRTRKN